MRQTIAKVQRTNRMGKAHRANIMGIVQHPDIMDKVHRTLKTDNVGVIISRLKYKMNS